MEERESSLLTCDSQSYTDAGSSLITSSPVRQQQQQELSEDIALEATRSNADVVMIDTVDAPSRSKHLAKAVSLNAENSLYPSDASFTGGGISV